jgi:hypothetical protein
LDGFFTAVPASVKKAVQHKLVLADEHEDARDRKIRKTPAAVGKSANHTSLLLQLVGKHPKQKHTMNQQR